MNNETIRKFLVSRAGGNADAKAFATATIDTWNEASAQLSSVIGGRGVNVLLKRSLHVAGKTYPSLAEPTHEGCSDVMLQNLKSRLAECDTRLAAEASSALLVTFNDLMGGLIGESLTERLLAPVWMSLRLKPDLKVTLGAVK